MPGIKKIYNEDSIESIVNSDMESPDQVLVYELSEELGTVLNSYILMENVTLADWVIPGKIFVLFKATKDISIGRKIMHLYRPREI